MRWALATILAVSMLPTANAEDASTWSLPDPEGDVEATPPGSSQVVGPWRDLADLRLVRVLGEESWNVTFGFRLGDFELAASDGASPGTLLVELRFGVEGSEAEARVRMSVPAAIGLDGRAQVISPRVRAGLCLAPGPGVDSCYIAGARAGFDPARNEVWMEVLKENLVGGRVSFGDYPLKPSEREPAVLDVPPPGVVATVRKGAKFVGLVAETHVFAADGTDWIDRAPNDGAAPPLTVRSTMPNLDLRLDPPWEDLSVAADDRPTVYHAPISGTGPGPRPARVYARVLESTFGIDSNFLVVVPNRLLVGSENATLPFAVRSVDGALWAYVTVEVVAVDDADSSRVAHLRRSVTAGRMPAPDPARLFLHARPPTATCAEPAPVLCYPGFFSAHRDPKGFDATATISSTRVNHHWVVYVGGRAAYPEPWTIGDQGSVDLHLTASAPVPLVGVPLGVSLRSFYSDTTFARGNFVVDVGREPTALNLEVPLERFSAVLGWGEAPDDLFLDFGQPIGEPAGVVTAGAVEGPRIHPGRSWFDAPLLPAPLRVRYPVTDPGVVVGAAAPGLESTWHGLGVPSDGAKVVVTAVNMGPQRTVRLEIPHREGWQIDVGTPNPFVLPARGYGVLHVRVVPTSSAHSLNTTWTLRSVPGDEELGRVELRAVPAFDAPPQQPIAADPNLSGAGPPAAPERVGGFAGLVAIVAAVLGVSMKRFLRTSW